MTNITKLPAIIHGRGDQEGKLYTQLKTSDSGACIYAVQNGDLTMYEVFKAPILAGMPSTRHTYPYGLDFGRIAFGVARLDDAEKLFEKLANA